MYTQNAKVYLKKDINDETAQKILTYFESMAFEISVDNIVAIFGSVNPKKGVDNSTILFKDRIEYIETSHFTPRQATILLEFIDQIYLLPELDRNYVVVLDKSKKSVRFNIKAPANESTMFYNLVKKYTQNIGAAEEPAVLVKCPNCGASCMLHKGEQTQCEYCNSPLIG